VIVRKNVILFLSLICLSLLVVHPVSATQWTMNSSAYNVGSIDIVNSTYMKDWMYYLIVTNSTTQWDFPVIGFFGSIMGPFTDAFTGIGVGSGNIVYLILFGLFILMVYRNSGKTTIPAMVACIVGGGWALLFPESAQPYCLILMCCAIAAQIVSFISRE
jgi:hypothetical protein